MAEKKAGTVRIGIREGAVRVVVEGEVRAAEAFALNEYLLPYVDGTAAFPRVFVDLSRCDYMDSTFIGFITALAIRCKKRGGEPVTVGNPSDRARAALKKLSAMKELLVSDGAVAPDVPVFALAPAKTSFDAKKNIELVFEAHRTLSELSEENRKEFAELLAELSRVLGGK